ncbi:tetratricopeptide repeat protein [Listeria booriae]|uniref:Uncharacterized protein n=1 Tax=Listeria booriae TaxID=1552123 RepID=A0A7X0XM53_9LIST|nr:hypothetical protein [Listeria booriae]MBC1563598.1 hypothetical protein [Listeria booriae]
MTWRIEIIESDVDSFFPGQEMTFPSFVQQTIAHGGEGETGMVRYKLIEAVNQERLDRMKLTFHMAEGRDAWTSFQERTLDLVRQKHLAVKTRKAYLASIQQELQQAAVVIPKRKKRMKLKPDKEPVIKEKQVREKKVQKTRKPLTWPTWVHKSKQRLLRIPSIRWKTKRWLVACLCVLVVAIGSVFLMTFMKQSPVASGQQGEPTPTFKELKAAKHYRQLFETYPEQAWEWESNRVEALDTDTLLDVYAVYPSANIAYDIAFMEKNYAKVIGTYEKPPTDLEINALRKDFAAYSYLQLHRLAEAKALATAETSPSFFEKLGWAYVTTGNMSEAKQCATKANSEELDKRIQDYELVAATWQEVKTQLIKKDLSAALRKQLEASKKELEETMAALKKEPRKDRESI